MCMISFLSGQLWRSTLPGPAHAWLQPSWPKKAKRRISLIYYKWHSHRVRLSFGSKPSVWSLLHHPQGTGRIKYHPFPAHHMLHSAGKYGNPVARTSCFSLIPPQLHWLAHCERNEILRVSSCPSSPFLCTISGGSGEPEAPMLGGSPARPRAAVLWLVQFSTYCGDDSVAVNSPQSVSFPFLNTTIPFPRTGQ